VILTAVGLALGSAALAAPGAAAGELRFTDIAAASGVSAPTWCGRPEKPHIMESNGTGLALLDYDGDGDLDLYLVNGWRLEADRVAERGVNRLYRNDGAESFADVTERAGVGDDGWGSGVGVGDIDGDGDADLMVTNFGPDVLYRNRGDGSFEVVANGPSIDGWSAGAVLFDADGDGDRDLYLTAYIDCTMEEVLTAEPELDWEGLKVMLGPFGLEGLGNAYFENLGDGTFRDATVEVGLEDVGLYYSFGVAAVDLDGDLDLDLYVANDSNPNYVYDNQGDGTFKEVGLWSGAALDAMGNAQAGMGLAAGDLNDDGLPDLLVTNFYKDVSTIYRNLGDFIFEDVTRAMALAETTFMPLSWGTAFADLDLDGDLDIFVANGHIYPQADEAPQAGTSFRQRNLLLANQGGSFRDVGEAAGPGLEVLEASHGLAVGDLDGDGDLDLAVSNVDAPATLLRNDSPPAGSWLTVAAPAAVRVSVEAGGRRRFRHRIAGGSFLSESDQRFHFGLGQATGIGRLVLEWPAGRRSVHLELPQARVLVIGSSRLPGSSPTAASP
jgi:hypothetical protein